MGWGLECRVCLRAGFWVIGFFLLGMLTPRPGVAAAVTDKDIQAVKRKLLALPWDSDDLVNRIEAAKKFKIPRRQNQGYSPTCGFYALSHTLIHFDPDGPTGQEAYSIALEHGWYWSEQGSSLGHHLLNTARFLGYRGHTGWGLSGGTIPYLKQLLAKGYGVVLAIRDVSNDGFPRYEEFLKFGGHFVALEGFVTLAGTEYLIVKDSRKTSSEPWFIEGKLNGLSLWPVKTFEAAWSFFLYVAIRASN